MMRMRLRGLALGAVDYITKPINPESCTGPCTNHLELKRYQDHLENLVESVRGG